MKTSADKTAAIAEIVPRHSFSWRQAWSQVPFLSFLWTAYALFVGCGVALLYLVSPRLHQFSDLIVTALTAAVIAFLLILGGGLMLLTVTSLTGFDLLYPHNKPSVTVSLLFPVAVWLARLVGINRNTLRVSFVKVNNSLTLAQRSRILGDRILILLPHCLQVDVCNRKVTGNAANCVRCGQCPVGRLLELGERYGLTIEVVNGGTLARSRVAAFRPDGIVAVACERDLTLGIQDVYPIPVYGVINDRPHGPCYNTEVDMDLVEQGIRFFKRDQSSPLPAPARQ